MEQTVVDLGDVGPSRDDRGRVLIIVQNLPVPFDRRVWLECRTLTGAGYKVTVVCPKGPGDPSFAVLEGVELYKYRPHTSGAGKASFVVEYLYSFMATLWLALKAARSGRFVAVQSCNPPDIFWPIGLLFRALHGSRFVFDHHDLCPETYEVRFPGGNRLLHKALLFLERRNTRFAYQVISTNDSYRQVAIERHGADPERVTVVRTGPDHRSLKRVKAVPSRVATEKHRVAYIGVMGPQDGVDIVLEVANRVVNEMGRKDIEFVLIGAGDCFDDLVGMCDRLNLQNFVEFTGRIPDESVSEILSSAEVGISPDPKNPLNDLCTMNKTMEYMAFGLPVVAFDLRETRLSAAGAALYARPNDVSELAQLLVTLVDDEPMRRTMGASGRLRIESELAWEHQAARYLGVYETISASLPRRLAATPK